MQTSTCKNQEECYVSVMDLVSSKQPIRDSDVDSFSSSFHFEGFCFLCTGKNSEDSAYCANVACEQPCETLCAMKGLIRA